MAMHWAQRCVFEHGQPYGDPQAHGQNIWAHSDQTLTPEQVVQDWFNEKQYYNYDSGDCSNVCGHYTAVSMEKRMHV